MKKYFSLSVVLLFIPFFMLANSAKTLFEIANDHFNKGEYEQSITLYDSLIKNNIVSSSIYYNLGNAYYKTDDIPRAILYYEKAKKIDPTNKDINYNLELANTHIADRIKSVPEFFLKTWWKKVVYFFNEEQWMYINIGVFSILMIFIAVYFVSNKPNTKKFSFTLSIIFILLSFISGIIGYNSYKIKTTHNTSIIFTPTVNVKSAPDENSSTIFILHQGTKVSLLDESRDWQKIKLANGSEGWLLKSDFEKI